MTIKEFKNSAEVSEFNTNNGWGFGGSFGKCYQRDNLAIKDHTFCYRHTGTRKETRFYELDDDLYAQTKTIDEFKQLINEKYDAKQTGGLIDED